MAVSIFILFNLICMALIPLHESADFPEAPQGPQAKLLKDLFINYEKRTRPVLNVTEVVHVDVFLHLYSLIDLDERNQLLKTSLGLNLKWNDSHLVWDLNDYDGVDRVYVPLDMVWMPDIVFRDSGKNPKPTELVQPAIDGVVNNHGLINFFSIGALETSCTVDVTYFPFDHQHCLIRLESWAHDVLKVILHAGKTTITTDFYTGNGQWTLDGTLVQSKLIAEEDFQNTFSHIEAHVYLTRKPLYHTVNIVIPCIIMSMMVCMVFIIPIEEGEKISLCITILLSFTVFLVVITGSMPKTSESTPILGTYITFIMGMSAMSLFITAIVLNTHFHNGLKPMPNWLMTMFHTLEMMMCMSRPSDYKQRGGGANCKLLTDVLDNSDIIAEEYLPENDTKKSLKQEERLSDHHLTQFHKATSLLQAILEELKTRHVNDLDHAVSKNRMEWERAAKIIDRFMFYLYIFSTIIVTFLMLGIYPISQPDHDL